MKAPTLPQTAKDTAKRQAELLEQAEPYGYTYDQFKGIAMNPTVPDADKPSLEWGAVIGKTAVDLLVNAAHYEKHLEKTDPNHPEHHEVREAIKDFEKGGFHRAVEELQNFVQGGNSIAAPEFTPF